MTNASAQKWLTYGSLCIVGANALFFVLAPLLGFPLEYSDSFRLAEVSGPVFFGYLGSVASYVFSSAPPARVRVRSRGLLPALVVGPLGFYVVVSVAAIAAFRITNLPTAAPGAGMTVDQLSHAMAIGLAVLAVTTHFAVTHLFKPAAGKGASVSGAGEGVE